MIDLLVAILALAQSSELDSRELALKIKNGDHRAFRMFFDRHYEALFRFLTSRGMSGPTAEDLIQQAFVIIWEKRTNIDEGKSLRSYLFRIAYTRMLNHIRDHSKFTTRESTDNPVSRSTPIDDLQEQELIEAIDAAGDSMPERRRMVFDFCFLQDFSYKETAEALDISVKTVENHMGLAFKDIRSALEKFRT